MTTRLARALIWMLLIFTIALVVGTSQNPLKKKQQQQTEKSDNTGAPGFKSPNTDFQKPDTEKESDDVIEQLVQQLTALTLWIQIGILYVTWRGVKLALGTLKQIREQTEAARKSADAAKKTADFISLTDRAFLNIVEWRLLPQKPNPMAFQAQLVNSGKIPAIVTKHIVRSVCAKGLPDEPDYSVAEEIKPIRVPVSPGYPEHVMAELKELDRTIDTMAVDQERKSIFVWGLIEYHDALGERVLRYGGRHITQREYGSLIQPVKINEFFNRSDVPPKYNYAD